MKHLFYLQNGTAVSVLPKGYNKFYVAENLDATTELSRYSYPGDNIQSLIDAMCVEMYDVFQDVVFPNRNDYYSNYDIQPQWISQAGMNSDFDMSKDELALCFASPLHDIMAEHGVTDEAIISIYREIDAKKYKYAYVADCQSLINTLQSLAIGCHSSFVGFYKHLCSLQEEPEMSRTYYECGPHSQMVYGFLYNFIIQSYSMFDVLTKIIYELEHINTCEYSYAKLASRKILYGDKKNLKIKTTGTVFEKCRTTSIIENLRNELVHNAVWEMNPKIYVDVDGKSIVSRYIFFPDFTTEGTLETFINRKRFFSAGNKVNDILPDLYFDIMRRIYLTLNRAIGKPYVW